MKTRLIYLISFVLVLFLAGQVLAQFPDHDSTWTDATGDHLWTTVDNWSEFPTPGAWAKIRNGLPGPTIPSGVDAVTRRVHIGYGEGGALTVDGGTLVLYADDFLLGKSGGSGILNMFGGSIDIARDFEVGGGNPGIVNMTGGTITVGDDFEIPETEGDADSPAEVHLDGGTITIGGDLHMFDYGVLDITAGTLILNGDAVSTIQGYIDNGWITPYDANGTLIVDYNDTHVGQTTVKAIHKYNPIPTDGGNALPGTRTLQWTVDPGTPVDVWFGSSPDWTTWEQLVDKQIVTSVTVRVDPKQHYYWGVDTYAPGAIDPEYGPIFSFLSDNIPPEVRVGDNVTTWIDDGSVEVALSGTVDDTDLTTTLWTVVSEPDDPDGPKAVIADSAALDTGITLSAVGMYVLKLIADDGEYEGEAMITINVFEDGCQAAQSLPGFEFSIGDLNHDCIVDDLDLALLQDDWLNCTALDCPDPDGQ